MYCTFSPSCPVHARREDYGEAEFTDCSSPQPLSQTQGCYRRLSSTSSCKHSQTLPECHGTAPIILSDSAQALCAFFSLELERGKTRGQRGSCQLHPHQGGVALVSTEHANNKTIMKPGSAAWRVCSNRERVCVIEAPISTCRICSDWAPLSCDSIQITFTSQLIYICQSIGGSPV